MRLEQRVLLRADVAELRSGPVRLAAVFLSAIGYVWLLMTFHPEVRYAGPVWAWAGGFSLVF